MALVININITGITTEIEGARFVIKDTNGTVLNTGVGNISNTGNFKAPLGSTTKQVGEWVSVHVDDFSGGNYLTSKSTFGWTQLQEDGIIVYPPDTIPEPTITLGVVDFTNPTNQTGTWDFGDGNSSNTTNPTHDYLNAGTYTVTFTDSTTNQVLSIEVIISEDVYVDPERFVWHTTPVWTRAKVLQD